MPTMEEKTKDSYNSKFVEELEKKSRKKKQNVKYKYESVTLDCSFNSLKRFNKRLQELLDKYADDGWALHTLHVAGATASVCVIVFEKEIELKDKLYPNNDR